MTDTNSIIKMNQLSKELQKHGFAANSEEGMKLAKTYFPDGAPEEIKVSETPKTVQTDTKAIDMFNQYKQATESRITDIENGLNTLLAKTNEIIKEINELQKYKDMAVGDRKEVQVKIPKKAEEKKEPHPKQGTFKSDDVAIDKIFYYGQK